MKSIIITGASSGIGRATAELFLREGWRVGLIARRADVLHQMAAEHDAAVALPADVTDAAAMEAAFNAFGHVDVLFNNAGLFGPSGPIDEIALEDWAQVLSINLGGMFIAARLAFAQMRAQGGIEHWLEDECLLRLMTLTRPIRQKLMAIEDPPKRPGRAHRTMGHQMRRRKGIKLRLVVLNEMQLR